MTSTLGCTSREARLIARSGWNVSVAGWRAQSRTSRSASRAISCGAVERSRAKANELEREVALAVADYAPQLLNLKGCGALTAAKIIGETAGDGRFRSAAQFARLAGSRPARRVLRAAATPSPESAQKPPAQRRAAQDRDRPGTLRPASPRLSGAQAGRRKEPPRSSPRAQAPPGAGRLSAASR